MLLNRDQYLGHMLDRRVCLFSMRDGARTVRFAATFEFMDDMDEASGIKPAERSAQFDRLRNRIEEIAERKFSLLTPEARPEELLLTSADLRHAR